MFNNDWDIILDDEINSDRFNKFIDKIYNDYKKFNVYPTKENIFKALETTQYKDVKVVIIGQDPYHQKGQANGLAFSVNGNIKLPPSLKNIFKEINRDLDIDNDSGNLISWANQGVLLLNTILTVKDSTPRYYANSYWEEFTNYIIKKIAKKGDVVFLLWGNDAIKKSELITSDNHILTSSHPSPLSAYRGFNGCGHFSKVNDILLSIGKKEIDWRTY